MIDMADVHAVEEMLKGGSMTRREIAKVVGVSHQTVNNIAKHGSGRWEDRLVEGCDEVAPEGVSGGYEKCPECGRKVLMPCVACRTKVRMAEAGGRLKEARARTTEEPLDLSISFDSPRTASPLSAAFGSPHLVVSKVF